MMMMLYRAHRSATWVRDIRKGAVAAASTIAVTAELTDITIRAEKNKEMNTTVIVAKRKKKNESEMKEEEEETFFSLHGIKLVVFFLAICDASTHGQRQISETLFYLLGDVESWAMLVHCSNEASWGASYMLAGYQRVGQSFKRKKKWPIIPV